MESVAEGPPVILSALRVAIVKHAHTPTGGAEDALADYLRPRASAVAVLAHPFPGARAVPPHSRWTSWAKGQLVEEAQGWRGHGPSIFYYLRDVFETLRRFLRFGTTWDVYVGVDNLNATVGIVLRALGRVRSVVFYVIDYVPKRFSNPLMNWLYHRLDRFAAKRADCVWNLGAAMASARAQAGLPVEKAAPQLVVPMGAPLADNPNTKSERPTAVYFGHLVAEQGVALLLDAWADVCANVPGATLRVVGSGEAADELHRQAMRLGINDTIEWLGFAPEDRIHDALSSCWVGVAPYPNVPDGYKQYADPGKLRWYCASGLPIVMTSVPTSASQFAEAGVATVVEPTAHELAEALVQTMREEPERRSEQQRAARDFAESYTWENIFDRAWRASIPHLEQRWKRR